jgi:2-methylaconitate cis-trans-isomerase PrpF
LTASESLACTVYRTGGATGLLLREEALPTAPHSRAEALQGLLHSPRFQTIAGADDEDGGSLEFLLVRRSAQPGADVECLPARLPGAGGPIDYCGTMGALVAAAGPYARAQGLGPAAGPVRIRDRATGLLLVAEFGSSLPGPVTLRWDGYPGGGGRPLFPTGRPLDRLQAPSGPCSVTLLDVGVPTLFLFASEVGLAGIELPAELRARPRTIQRMEVMRQGALGLAGIRGPVGDLSLVAAVALPMTYLTTAGSTVRAAEIDLLARYQARGTPSPAFDLFGAIATAVAAGLEGTVVAEVARIRPGPVRIGHPGGVVSTQVALALDGELPRITSAEVTVQVEMGRT